jgi:hypothetical protein
MAIAAVMVGAVPALADGTEPKPKAADYPAHAEAGAVALGAEYMVHSFAGRKQTFIARDFLVVEVGLFAGAGERIEVSNGQFALRVNRKTMLIPQAPSFVAASLKYPDWESRPALEAADAPAESAARAGAGSRRGEAGAGARRGSRGRHGSAGGELAAPGERVSIFCLQGKARFRPVFGVDLHRPGGIGHG